MYSTYEERAAARKRAEQRRIVYHYCVMAVAIASSLLAMFVFGVATWVTWGLM